MWRRRGKNIPEFWKERIPGELTWAGRGAGIPVPAPIPPSSPRPRNTGREHTKSQDPTIPKIPKSPSGGVQIPLECPRLGWDSGNCPWKGRDELKSPPQPSPIPEFQDPGGYSRLTLVSTSVHSESAPSPAGSGSGSGSGGDERRFRLQREFGNYGINSLWNLPHSNTGKNSSFFLK